MKKKLGQQAGNQYASNLLTLVVLFLGIISALCIAFPSVAIYTQSFYSDQTEMAQSVFFFQFFAIQIVMYGATAIVSGLLNANRDYLWSSIAPVANNVIVIATFILYAVVAPQNQEMALYIIAIGNPLGVFVQLAIQLPALKKNGIRIRPRVDFRDPALRETLGLGIPALFVMLCSTIVVSVQTAAAYGFSDNGPSILLYARQWFTLPYAFLAVPITTAMFTELADMQAEGDAEGVKRGIIGGTNQILFFMIPFALYLMVFALPLVTLYHAGAFTMDNVNSIATYMTVLAFALPVYGVNTYLQKIFSSLRKMGVFAAFNFVAGAAQIALTMFGAANVERFPIEIIAAAEVLFYVVADVCLFAYLPRAVRPAVGGESVRARPSVRRPGRRCGQRRAVRAADVRRAAVRFHPAGPRLRAGRWHRGACGDVRPVHQAARARSRLRRLHRGQGEGQAGTRIAPARAQASTGEVLRGASSVEIPVGRGALRKRGEGRRGVVRLQAGRLQGHPLVRARDGVRAVRP